MPEEVKQTIEEIYYNHQIDRRTQILINLDNCEKIFTKDSKILMNVLIKLSEKFLSLNDSEIILSDDEKVELIYNCKIDFKGNMKKENEEKIEKLKNEIEELEKKLLNNGREVSEIWGKGTLSEEERRKERNIIYRKNTGIHRQIKERGSKIFYTRINIRHIPNIQEELAKGKTRILITNCSGYKVIEAIAFNVGIFCLPRRDEQFYVSKALKNNYDNFQKEENVEDTRIDSEIEEIQSYISLESFVYNNVGNISDYYSSLILQRYANIETAILKMFETK
uniref:DDE-1 domain-containing protein n=1 Tax=Meloidogyne hapla TaxID=6305 RepID=A0A1I8B6K9_MELHA